VTSNRVAASGRRRSRRHPDDANFLRKRRAGCDVPWRHEHRRDSGGRFHAFTAQLRQRQPGSWKYSCSESLDGEPRARFGFGRRRCRAAVVVAPSVFRARSGNGRAIDGLREARHRAHRRRGAGVDGLLQEPLRGHGRTRPVRSVCRRTLERKRLDRAVSRHLPDAAHIGGRHRGVRAVDVGPGHLAGIHSVHSQREGQAALLRESRQVRLVHLGLG